VIPRPGSKLLKATVMRIEGRGAMMRMVREDNQSVECLVDLSAIAYSETLRAMGDAGMFDPPRPERAASEPEGT